MYWSSSGTSEDLQKFWEISFIIWENQDGAVNCVKVDESAVYDSRQWTRLKYSADSN